MKIHLLKIEEAAQYDPTRVNDAQLRDDWRIVCAWWSSFRQGKKIKFNKETIIRVAKRILFELFKRKQKNPKIFTAKPKEMKKYSRELYELVVKDWHKGVRELLEKQTLIEVPKVISKILKKLGLVITFYGTKGMIEEESPKHKYNTAILFERLGKKLLIDYGEVNPGNLKEIKPDYILNSHAHPDHIGGLSDMQVWISEQTSKVLPGLYRDFNIDAKIYKSYQPFDLGPFKITAIPVHHSIKAPMSVFKIRMDNYNILVATDIVAFHSEYKEKYLTGIDLAIMDGSTLTRPLIRRRDKDVYGHSSVKTQLRWYEHIPGIILTHLGKELVEMDEKELTEKLKEMAPGKDVRIAHDFETFKTELEKEFAPVYPSGIKEGREITLKEVLLNFKTFRPWNPICWIVGGLVNWGRTRGDIDLLWRFPPEMPEYFRHVLEFRVGRMFEDRGLAERIHHTYDIFHGPFTKCIPIYALDISRINEKANIIEASFNEAETQEMVWDEAKEGYCPDDWLYRIEKQRVISEEIKRQAEASKKEDKIKMFRYFIPLKPTRGYFPETRQTIDVFLSLFKDTDFPVYSSKKYDGVHTIIFKKGNKVKLFSEDGGDNTYRLPIVVKEIQKLKIDGLVALAELEVWDEKKHLPREAATAYLAREDEPDDSNVVLNVYDVVYWNGKDIHKLQFEERFQYLDRLNIGQSTWEEPDLKIKLNKAPYLISYNRNELKQHTEFLRKLPGSEGNVAKIAKAIYRLDGLRSGMIKFHNSTIFNGIVTDIKETKVKGVFNYVVGILPEDYEIAEENLATMNNKNYAIVGRTFSTSLKAKVGDVLEVECETFNLEHHPKDDTWNVTAWAPRVMRTTEAEVDTIGSAVERAKRDLVFQEKEITPEGEIVYKRMKPAFGSPGGKRFLAEKIVRLIPEHRIYVEPFAGGAAVFFKKEPSDVEILNDFDPEIMFRYRFIKYKINKEVIEKLKEMSWFGGRKHFYQIAREFKPKNDFEKFYRSLYLSHFSYGKIGETWGGFPFRKRNIDLDKLLRIKERLSKVKLYNQDYSKIFEKFDSKDTFFCYLDPPYPGLEPKQSWKSFDYERFHKLVKKLRGKWILSFQDSQMLREIYKDFYIRAVKVRRTMNQPAHKREARTWRRELLISNVSLDSFRDLYFKKEYYGQTDLCLMYPDEEGEVIDKEFFEKGAFTAPGGKEAISKRIVKYIPPHRIYVEPFCGAASIFFKKELAEIEILNDKDPNVIFILKNIRDKINQEKIEELEKKFNWTCSKSQFSKLKNLKPKNRDERFYKLLYLYRYSDYGNRQDLFDPAIGKTYDLASLLKYKDRLQRARIFQKDYKEMLKFDSKDTFFYFDPPYLKGWKRLKLRRPELDYEDFAAQLKKLKGKFLLSYEIEPEARKFFRGFYFYRIPKVSKIPFRERGNYEYLISNFKLKAKPNHSSTSKEKLTRTQSGEPGAILKQADPYLAYPKEEETYRYAVQHHWRGKTVHADLRMENFEKKFLIGWTLTDGIKGEIKKPVLTMEDAEREDNDMGNFKFDWKKGVPRKRKTRAGTIVFANIFSVKKAREPVEWLEFEGRVEPGTVGATKEFPGVFHIIDKGTVEYGAQKPWFHEYFFHSEMGRMKGRFVWRALTQPEKEKQEILPPGKEEELREAFFWVMMKPLDETPYVLSQSAVEENWVSPAGVSALPKEVRKKLPARFRYWLKDSEKERSKIRNAYLKSLEEKEKMEIENPEDWAKLALRFIISQQTRTHWEMFGTERKRELVAYWTNLFLESNPLRKEWLPDLKQYLLERRDEFSTLLLDYLLANQETVFKQAEIPFVLQRHWWRGQVVIRFGPSTQHWDLRYLLSPRKIQHFVLQGNPLKEERAILAYEKHEQRNVQEQMTMGEDGPVYQKPSGGVKEGEPGYNPWNPTKDTPAYVDMIDKGKMTLLVDQPEFKKFEFRGKKLKGLWTLQKETGAKFWAFKKSELPQP